MVPENKQNNRYKQIYFIGLQNNHPDLAHAGARSGENSGLLSVSPPEEQHENTRFADVAAI
jgi:hypothetical protein